jgi:hypothetical protein
MLLCLKGFHEWLVRRKILFRSRPALGLIVGLWGRLYLCQLLLRGRGEGCFVPSR